MKLPPLVAGARRPALVSDQASATDRRGVRPSKCENASVPPEHFFCPCYDNNNVHAGSYQECSLVDRISQDQQGGTHKRRCRCDAAVPCTFF